MSAKKKRILMIIEGISLGGTSTSFLNLLTAMRNYPQVEITVGLINMDSRDKLPQGTNIVDLSQLSRIKNNKIQKLCHILKSGFFNYLRMKMALMFPKASPNKILRRISLRQKYEMGEARAVRTSVDFRNDYYAVISWCEMYTNYLLAFKIKAKHKIAWIHPHYEQAKFSAKIDKKMVSMVDKVVAVSKEGKYALKRAFPEFADKLHFVYNKLIVAEVVEKSQKENIVYTNDVLNIITVGRIQNASKAYNRTLSVMKKLKQEGFRFKWRIIGDGENARELKEMIREYNLNDEVEMLGAHSNPFPYVVASDLFLLASRYEGFPMVVNETKALGVPPMVTNYAAANEQVVHGETGFVVPNSEDGIYEGLASILKNPQVLNDIRGHLNAQNNDLYINCDDFISLI